MLSAVLDVREIPDLLVTKFHSNMFSWHEENGTMVLQPTDDDLVRERKRAAFERLKQSRKTLPGDFDYKEELLRGIDEKYGSVN